MHQTRKGKNISKEIPKDVSIIRSLVVLNRSSYMEPLKIKEELVMGYSKECRIQRFINIACRDYVGCWILYCERSVIYLSHMFSSMMCC